MTPHDRLEIAASAMKAVRPEQMEFLDGMDAADIARISESFDLKVDDTPKLIGVIIYIKCRLVERKGRIPSFKAAFPERCIATDDGTRSGRGSYKTITKVGDQLPDATIEVKAKRLEQTRLYLHVYNLLQTNLYVAYAVERMRVLDEALDIALDERTPLRDKDRYMKIFLDETRKPDNAKQLEVNLNVQSNTVNVVSVEEKMNTIAQALNHASAGEVLDMIEKGKSREEVE